MIWDPVNSITSIEFYKKVAGQHPRRSVLYLCYLGLLFSLLFIVFLKVRIWPAFAETFQWMETSVPAITYANGRLSTPTNEKVTIRHPKQEQVAFTLDTGRTDPVNPQTMRDDKVSAYVTANVMYIMEPGGKVNAYDFSKSPPGKTVVFDAKFYRELARILGLVLYPLGFAACFAMFVVWKLVATLFYSLFALLINGLSESGLPYRTLFNLSAYAQTLVVAVQAILMLVPARVPFFGFFTIVATAIYLWLAIRRIVPAPPQAA